MFELLEGLRTSIEQFETEGALTRGDLLPTARIQGQECVSINCVVILVCRDWGNLFARTEAFWLEEAEALVVWISQRVSGFGMELIDFMIV
jgi:hypothetical protein